MNRKSYRSLVGALLVGAIVQAISISWCFMAGVLEFLKGKVTVWMEWDVPADAWMVATI